MAEETRDPKPLRAGRVLVHEGALLALGVGTFVALLVRAGPFDAIPVEIGIVSLGYAGMVFALRGSKAPWQKLRLAAGLGYALWFYAAVARITPALGLPLRDRALYLIDQTILGASPAVSCQGYVTPWLTDLMSASYLSYHVYLILAFAHAFSRPLEYTLRLCRAIATAFAVGMLGYLLVPAVGPARAYAAAFTTPLTGGTPTWLNNTLVNWGSSVYDVFPSLHILVTCLLLEHDWRFLRSRFWLMILPALGLLMSTVYLRYHYAIDLAAGIVLYVVIREVVGWQPKPGACASG